jgi:WD40 repeat protein
MDDQPFLPKLIARSNDITGDSNFTQGCKFSPDGLCILTSTASDNLLRLYNTPSIPQKQETQEKQEHEGKSEGVKDISTDEDADISWKTILSAKGGDSIRSYAWYPLMNSYQPASCAFITSCRDQPIHLIDAYTGSIRATYSPYNALDEMEAPNVLQFTPGGDRIFASGFRTDRTIHKFDVSRPGRDSDILRLGKTRRSKDGQKGIVSAIAFPDKVNSAFAGSNVFAVGTYSPGSIYVYDDRLPNDDPAGVIMNDGIGVVGHGKNFGRKKRRLECIEEEEKEGDQDLFSAAKVSWYQARIRTGVTQLTWSRGSQNDYLLYSASRRSDAVVAFDMRMLTGDASHPIRGVTSYARDSDTNQRLEFDFDSDGKHIFVGSQDCSIKVYDTWTGKLVDSIEGFHDAVNGLSFSNQNGRTLLAVASGARRFSSMDDDEDVGSIPSGSLSNPPGSLSIYSI